MTRVLDKGYVVDRIRELVASNDGRVSFDTFIAKTGIPAQRLRRQTWFTSWNALLSEIGMPTASFAKPRTPDATIAAAVARLVEKINKWPTEDDFVREKTHDSSFPSLQVIRRVRKSGKLLSLLKEHCAGDTSLLRAERIIVAQPEPTALVDSQDASDNLDRIQGHVYLLRYGSQYKIGRTNTPVRRFREVQLELPNETVIVHTIETDDPKGIEAYWHNRFLGKRVRTTEWFDLNADDVRVFKRRKYQ